MHIKPGDRTSLVPTDPWEFVTSTGSGPFGGTVTNVDSAERETIVIRLDNPIHYEGVEAHFIEASTRHVGDKFESLFGGTVFCNVMSLTNEEGRTGFLAQPISFENRLGFIGDISWTPS